MTLMNKQMNKQMNKMNRLLHKQVNKQMNRLLNKPANIPGRQYVSLILAGFLFVLFAGWPARHLQAQDRSDTGPLGIALENFDYPYPPEFLSLKMEGKDVRMAYMDVAPTGEANGRTVLLMHGKNFFGAYWEDTIRLLAQNGYRVVVPDQIGFGKSSKPDVNYSFHQMGQHTRQLLDT
ncbi:MAG: alpha/beta fold hydrolase, partial [Balneolaceae bacterium]